MSSITEVDEAVIFEIAQRKADNERTPVHIYGFVALDEDDYGEIRAADSPSWILRTDLDNAEQGEPRQGFHWATLDPRRQSFALTAKSRAALEEDDGLVQALEARYQATLGYQKALPEGEEVEAGYVREELPEGPAAGRRQVVVLGGDDDELAQIVLALSDLFDDEEFQAMLMPYLDESKWTSRAKVGAVTGVLDSFIYGMLDSDQAIDKEALKAAFATYLEDIERIREKRARPEVAKQTIAAFSYAVPKSRTSKGTFSMPRWEGVKPESMHGKRFLSQEDLPMLERVKRIEQRRLADRKDEAEARRKSYRAKQRREDREFVGSLHPTTGTYTARTRKRKKTKKRRR